MTIHFDLEVTARSAYTPFNSSLNAIHGRFAQINLAANQQVALRATVKRSCSSADSCNVCNALTSFAERVHCYAEGCSCVGVTVFSPAACGFGQKESFRAAYNCSWAADTLVLPSTVRTVVLASQDQMVLSDRLATCGVCVRRWLACPSSTLMAG